MSPQKKSGRAASGKRKGSRRSSRAHSHSLGDVGRRLEQEAQELINFINDEVVPTVRNRSSSAIRTAARKLEEFADYMDRSRGKS